MSWLSRRFATPPSLSAAQAARLAAWQALPEIAPDAPLSATRLVVVDVETSGLDARHDRLIAIGALGIAGLHVQLGDAVECVLQQAEVSSPENILIHGIDGTTQRAGRPPAEALLEFLEFVGKAPLLAFHVAFDQTMIARALQDSLGLRFAHRWLDLAYLAPALHSRLAHRLHALDDWTAHFGIGNFARHRALADALATAELFLALQPALRERGIDSVRDLSALEQAWLRQRRLGA